MIKRFCVAVAVAALLAVQMSSGALATNRDNDNENDDKRDGQSRYELAPINHLPLIFAAAAQERIVKMLFIMQTVSYLVEMTAGVEVTSQDRVRLGGLFGSVFGATYSPENFVKSLEVGTVYRAGNGTLAVAMADDEVLSEHRVIVFNGDYQYDPKALPSLQQIAPDQMQKLQAYSLMVELARHTLTAPVLNVIANLNHLSAADLNNTADLTDVQRQTEIPALRQLIVGKVYRGPDNTMLVLIPPAIVTED